MSEVSNELPITQPLANGESRNIPPITSRYGTYGLELRRDNKYSSVTLISEKLQPFEHIIQTIHDPPDEIENRDAWVALYKGVSNIGRIYEPRRDERVEREQYQFGFHSNGYDTEYFLRDVLKPMERIGLIPEAVVDLFS